MNTKSDIRRKTPIEKTTNHFYFLLTILLLVTFASFQPEIDTFSNSFIGRFLAILIIIYSIRIHSIFGLLMCVVVIYYYYRTDIESIKYPWLNYRGSNIDEGFSDSSMQPEVFEYTPNDPKEYDFREYEMTNEMNKFVQNHCDENGRLMNDGIAVNPEMASHIFPELKFDYSHCDPCNSRCKFSVMDQRLNAEEELVKPKNSNEWYDSILPLFELPSSIFSNY